MPLARRPRAERDLPAAVRAGVLAGVVSAFVKLGWEQLLPPRLPDRVEPPALVLSKLGVPTDSLTITFSGQQVDLGSLGIHFAFSIGTVVLYCVLAERFPLTTLWRGVAFGVGVWVVAHLVVLPALGLTPAPWSLPVDEDVSELLGHAVWLWSADLVRRAVLARPPGARSPAPA